ncbi:hypothetical protein [Protofrankia symbiont of Coriaria ruscifolia]|uniref:hypothetical protein n=1 Tax=Protofrankia symbiont of Coriaria ruscifolia TaxID=1306542 RepID=UPI0013EF6070|nr:hypothetical protein [Protofrankia symbiont of Coriaria ruscifolia]
MGEVPPGGGGPSVAQPGLDPAKVAGEGFGLVGAARGEQVVDGVVEQVSVGQFPPCGRRSRR